MIPSHRLRFDMPDWTFTCLLLAAGGSAGTLSRYWLGRAVTEAQTARWPELEFPVGTLFINVSGSIALGFLAAICAGEPSRRTWYLLLGTGFCGGFTTFSTFSLETYELIRDGRLLAASAYSLGSVAAGILGVWCAMKAMGR
jgi:fluoride exporter